MPRTMVLGGAGFVGTHVCKYLLDIGHEVIVMDNLISGSTSNMERIRTDKFRFLKQDITEYLYFTEDIDYILNLASPASPLVYVKYPIHTLKVGALGTHKSLGLAFNKHAIFLLASTSEVYGDPKESPQRESYHGNVDHLSIRGFQDEARRFAESMTMAYHRYHNLNTRIARVYNTYGPYMKPYDGRSISTFILQALKNEPLTIYGDGTQRRAYCYVSDVVEGIYKLLNVNYANPVNIGSPDLITIQDLAERILSLCKSKSKIIYKPRLVDDPDVRHPDITLAKELLNWEPKISLDEGLILTIEWYKRDVISH